MERIGSTVMKSTQAGRDHFPGLCQFCGAETLAVDLMFSAADEAREAFASEWWLGLSKKGNRELIDATCELQALLLILAYKPVRELFFQSSSQEEVDQFVSSFLNYAKSFLFALQLRELRSICAKRDAETLYGE